jgi:FixJ family two-component response regulator
MSQARYVAIVDDDAAVRNGIARLLRAHGVESRTYDSGRRLLDALPLGTPDCLIADVHMPEMTGFELQSELARRGHHIPTVVITGVDDRSHPEKCRALGAVAYLRKPVESQTLIAAIMPYLRPEQQDIA